MGGFFQGNNLGVLGQLLSAYMGPQAAAQPPQDFTPQAAQTPSPVTPAVQAPIAIDPQMVQRFHEQLALARPGERIGTNFAAGDTVAGNLENNVAMSLLSPGGWSDATMSAQMAAQRDALLSAAGFGQFAGGGRFIAQPNGTPQWQWNGMAQTPAAASLPQVSLPQPAQPVATQLGNPAPQERAQQAFQPIDFGAFKRRLGNPFAL